MYNAKIKPYATNTQVTLFERALRENRDVLETFNKANKNTERTEKQEEHCKRVSLNNTKRNMYDIARSNDWDWFITLTFDRNKIDSSDYDLVSRTVTQFMGNWKRRKASDLMYLNVPELHNDKKHYHVHGIVSNVGNMEFELTDKVTCPKSISSKGYCNKSRYPRGQPIYNIAGWNYGWSTATQVQHSGKVANYITKYITKDLLERIGNKKRYWPSRNLKRVETYKDYLDIDDFLKENGNNIANMKSVRIPDAGQTIHYIEMENNSCK